MFIILKFLVASVFVTTNIYVGLYIHPVALTQSLVFLDLPPDFLRAHTYKLTLDDTYDTSILTGIHSIITHHKNR